MRGRNQTEDVLTAVAGNEGCGVEILMLLLEQRDREIVVTEKVVIAALANERTGKEAVALLLKKRGEGVKITHNIVSGAVSNSKYKKTLMALLEQRNEEIDLAEEIVKAITRILDKEGILELLEQRSEDIEAEIMNEIANAVVANIGYDRGNTWLLLRQHERAVNYTIMIIYFCMCSEDREVLRLLLDNWLWYVSSTERSMGFAIQSHSIILYAATITSHMGVLVQLLMNGVDVNTMIADKETALHIAAAESHDSFVQMLLDNRSNPDMKDLHGWTPFALASAYRNDSICGILLEHGSGGKPDCGKSTGLTPNLLVTATMSPEIIISDDGYTATSGTLLIQAPLKCLFAKVLLEFMEPPGDESMLQVRGNHPIPLASHFYYFEVGVLSTGLKR